MIISMLLLTLGIGITPETKDWNQVFIQLKQIPEYRIEWSKTDQIKAEIGRLNASYHPQVQAYMLSSGSNNPAAVFAGKLGNREFLME